jgi:hypothetical protein
MVVRALGIALALLTLAVFGTLIVFVLGDDEYLGDGTSRWASRADDPEARAAFWCAGALTLLGVAGLLAGALQRRLGLVLAGMSVAAVAVLAAGYGFVAFAGD